MVKFKVTLTKSEREELVLITKGGNMSQKE